MNYEKVFNYLVNELENYLITNGLQSMVLGISGGIDSTVVAAIGHEVSKRTGIPLIGRSLPSKFNKDGEISAATKVGNAFCTDFSEIPIQGIYEEMKGFVEAAGTTPRTNLANGNIQARIRMIFLYDLASCTKGLVLDTDNMTEHYLGYFTLHGDQGDYNPTHCLWKMEVFGLAQWLSENYYSGQKSEALKESGALIPTAGLGITNSDLEEIGANSYTEVDYILKSLVNEGSDCIPRLEKEIGAEIVGNVFKRYKASGFKRAGLPIHPIISEDVKISGGVEKENPIAPGEYWIARDKDERLFIYEKMPIRCKGLGFFFSLGGMIKEYSKEFFPGITWENSPQKINLRITP